MGLGPFMRFVAIMVLAGIFSLVAVAPAIMAGRWLKLGDDFRPEVQLPVLLVSGLIALLITLAALVAAFHIFELTDPDKPFGVPEGTLQAVIALTIILIFSITSLFLRGSLDAERLTVTGLTRNQVDAIPPDLVLQVQERRDERGVFDVERLVPVDEDAKDFSNQLLTILGTLVGAVAGFYFGAKSVETGVSAGGAPDPPKNTSPPVITGSPRGGQTLQAGPGGWTGSPNFGHQWQRKAPEEDEWADIKGANQRNYVVAHDDRDKMIRVAVTATNAGGRQTAYSDPTETIRAEAPASAELPTIDGELQEGAVLSASPGRWSGWPEPTFLHMWERAAHGSDVWEKVSAERTENATYSLTREDVGHRLRVHVTAKNVAGENTAVAPEVGPISGTPMNTAIPTIAGDAQVGKKLEANPGTWTGWPLSYSYRWERSEETPLDWKPISGATAAEYLLTPEDAHHLIRVVVAVGTVEQASEPTGRVEPA